MKYGETANPESATLNIADLKIIREFARENDFTGVLQPLKRATSFDWTVLLTNLKHMRWDFKQQQKRSLLV